MRQLKDITQETRRSNNLLHLVICRKSTLISGGLAVIKGSNHMTCDMTRSCTRTRTNGSGKQRYSWWVWWGTSPTRNLTQQSILHLTMGPAREHNKDPHTTFPSSIRPTRKAINTNPVSRSIQGTTTRALKTSHMNTDASNQSYASTTNTLSSDLNPLFRLPNILLFTSSFLLLLSLSRSSDWFSLGWEGRWSDGVEYPLGVFGITDKVSCVSPVRSCFFYVNHCLISALVPHRRQAEEW